MSPGKLITPIAAAARCAEWLLSSNMGEDPLNALEALGLDTRLDDSWEFTGALDILVFRCEGCDLWYRQADNATPDGARWYCEECKP